MLNPRVRRRLSFFLTVGFCIAPASAAMASEAGQAAAVRVQEASYRHYLDDLLYTHPGDNRGFGAEHDLARANIVFVMESLGLSVSLEPVPYGGETYYNVVGTKLGTTYPDQEYVIGAHYDSVNNPGADDNASGVALVLEAARVLSPFDSDYTIRFVAFDREEQGLHGSEDYVITHFDDDILGMISTDMVAYNTGANSADIHGRSASNPIKFAVADAVATYSQGLSTAILGPLDASDHAPFEWYGFQACLLIEDWGNPYYHSQLDNVDMPNYIDYAYATKMTRAVVGFLVDHAGVAVELPDGDFNSDGDVDIDDYYAFVACFTGPDGGPLEGDCIAGDFDFDDDIDCDDWVQFRLAWTEPTDPPDFDNCAVVDPEPAPAPHDAPKNRYISFLPTTGGHEVAFRVELLASTQFPESTGVLGWVTPPDADGVSRLAVDPTYGDSQTWSEEAIHVGDCGILPVATYGVRSTVIASEVFSATLILTTIAEPTPKKWADTVGIFLADEWTWPNGAVNFTDVQVAVLAFQLSEDAPHFTRLDLDAEVPNGVVNFTDIQLAVQGFQGQAYPFSDPLDCP